ncbi:MAG: prepilin-type N-terminal cleavage/methylation domain-containing protein [Armatimonadetes bacterium]|nr:prepilin-type N-terminal cleavage/methylation domain-containing protein [Armatimonadota bacterium]
MRARTPTFRSGTSRAARPRSAGGLTLVELLVVLALIAMVSAALVPSFAGVLSDTRLRAGARSILAQCRYARDLAVQRATYARVVFDSGSQIHAVTWLQPEEGEQAGAPAGGQAARASGERKWLPASNPIGRPIGLPEGVEFDRLATKSESGEPAVTFAPDGSAEDWFVALRNDRGTRLAVKVTATTGAVEVLSPEDGKAFDELEAQFEEQRP